MKKEFIVESSIIDTLHAQFSGYGTTRVTTKRTLEKFADKDPLEYWNCEKIVALVDAFLEIRFPTIIVRNLLTRH